MTGSPALAAPGATRTPGATSQPRAAGDVLAGLATADGVLRFLTNDVPELLAAALAEVLPSGVPPIRARVTRAKLKPGRKLTVSVDVTGDGIPRRPVTVTWDRSPGPAPVPEALLARVSEAQRSPFSHLTIPADAKGMSVLIAPVDPAFPQLPDIYDPVRLATLVAGTAPGAIGPGLNVTPLRYRPGQRHVLLVESADGRDRLFAKCYRDDAGRRALAASEVVGEALSAWGGPARVVQATGYVESHRLALWTGHGGTVLSALVSRPTPQAVVLSARAGAALRAVHDIGRPLPDTMRGGRTDVAAEAASTRRAVDHVAVLAAPAGARITALLDRTLAELHALPEESGHLLHGDFKCDNILVEDGVLRLLDVDRVTAGDPALDLGKLSADLRWWARAGRADAGTLVSALLDGYGPCPPARRRRADLYDVLFQLRAVGRRVALQDAGWAEAVEACVASAERTHRSAG